MSSSRSRGGHCAMAEHTVRPALAELVLVRLREFIREPEAVFWTFVFPLLLAAGLGIAFRNRPPETLRVGVAGATEAAVRASIALKASNKLLVDVYATDSAASRALATGVVTLIVAPDSTGGLTYQ